MIVLVGMPGCGKSTIGRLLARRLHVDFGDSDQVIEQRLGCSIRSYFDSHGEAAFRDVEEEVLAQLLRQEQAVGVLATGGGAVLRSANRAAMRAAAHVVYLKVTPEEIVRRVKNDTKRPLLQVANPLQRLRSLLAERDTLYREVAHTVVDAGHGSSSTVVNLIAMQLEQAQWAEGGAAHGSSGDPQ
ncbi:MAG: shikimate kinase [Burkholderiaceae bacterium]|nr:MAG: shikimate kinase [Burkholderiaceae bacterium]